MTERTVEQTLQIANLYELYCVKKFQDENPLLKVWHWNNVPEESLFDCGYINSFKYQRVMRLKYKKENMVPDSGFDMLIYDINSNTYHGGQCKHYESSNINYTDISTFIEKVNLIRKKNISSKGYLFSIANLTKECAKSLNNIGKGVFTFKKYLFDYSNIINKPNNLKINNINEQEYSIRDYQQDIIQNILLYFSKEDTKRILLCLPCGMGKTIIAGNVLKECMSKLIVCVAPEKMQVENLKNRIPAFLKEYQALLFDSDHQIGGFTDVDVLINSIISTDKNIIIFTTFKSVEEKLKILLDYLDNKKVDITSISNTITNETVIKLKEIINKSVLLIDEVHNAYNKQNICEFAEHFNMSLFMTATPPEGLDEHLSYDISINKYDFKYALDNKYITDYNVWIPLVTNNNNIDFNEDIYEEIKLTRTNSFITEKVIFLLTGMLKTGSRKTIVYCHTKKECYEFNKLFNEIGNNYYGVSTKEFMIIEDTSPKDRFNILQEFEKINNITHTIITSCGCLDEAIDIISCDSEFITFMGDKSSQIRTIQRLMRGGRVDAKNPNKINNLFIWTTSYKNVEYALQLFKNSDIKFKLKLKIMDINYDNQHTKESETKIKIMQETVITNIFNNLYTMEDVWNKHYKNLQEFILNNAYYPKPRSNSHEETLRKWIYKQKVWYNNDINGYPKKYIELLNCIPKWTWAINNLNRSSFDESLYAYKDFINKYKRLPSSQSKDANECKLGNWCLSQRQNKKNNILSADKILKIEREIPEWKWKILNKPMEFRSWDESYERVVEFVKTNGRLPSKYTKINDYEQKLGSWCKTNKEYKTNNNLSEEKQKKLEVLQGWKWSIPKNK